MSPTQMQLSRREMLSHFGLGVLGSCCAGWLPAFASQLASDPQRKRHCILLWMNGGPSQIDTFDMKPQHENGGEFKEAQTRVPGLRFSEHLPKLAEHADRLAIVRSLSTKEGDHARGTHLVRTGQTPMGDVAYPSIACSLAKELAHSESQLPSYVSVAPRAEISPPAFGPGFLGQKYAPAIVDGIALTEGVSATDTNGRIAELRMDNIHLPSGVAPRQAERRMQLWRELEDGFFRQRTASSLRAHHDLYLKAAGLMTPEVRDAFDLSREPQHVRSRYGPGLFGQGCLLARRLVQRGVPFVEVALGDGLAWDTHDDNFTKVQRLSAELDAGWSTLMTELDERGLLDSTTILWMGEFGRTPKINGNGGRDHFPSAWSCVLAGGGIAGGQAYGRTSPDGSVVEENRVEIGDVLATLSTAVGVSPDAENVTGADRPIKIAEGEPIDEILA
ncbi:MAG: DUF1501 domain-containing protein [Planctomycetota bacterium]